MGQLNGNRIDNALGGLFSALDAADRLLVKKLFKQQKLKLDIHDSATAGTAFTKTFMWENETGVDVQVVAGAATAPIAVTANASTYASFIVSRLDAAGSNAAVVATFATDTVTTDDMVANVPKDMTLTPANVIIPAGGILVGEVTKASTGVAITAATSRASIVLTIEPV